MSRTSEVRQLAGAQPIMDALQAGAPVGLLLVVEDAQDPALRATVDLARKKGVPVREATRRVLDRVSQCDPPSAILALLGRRPEASLAEVAEGEGALWLLVGVAYPGNVGMAIRTAEVSGADGIVVDSEFDHEQRRAAVRFAMRADWYMPVLWDKAEVALEAARAAGRRIVALEDFGSCEHWQADLTGRALFVVGAERHGIPRALLEDCDQIVRVPMGGFLPSYNLQAAVSAIATERLRQIDQIR